MDLPVSAHGSLPSPLMPNLGPLPPRRFISGAGALAGNSNSFQYSVFDPDQKTDV
jgi:hypothetical protein